MTNKRVFGAGVAMLGAAGAVPIPLAQLDFAGLVNVFNIDAGDTPDALRVLAGLGGTLTFAVVAAAFAGAVLAFTGAAAARTVLLAAAVAGLATALPLWIPTAIVLGAAAALAERDPGVIEP